MQKPHIVFLEDLQKHSVCEVCQGAAEYAAEHQGWVFNPWPLYVKSLGSFSPSPDDLHLIKGMITTAGALASVGHCLSLKRSPQVNFLDKPSGKIPSVNPDEAAIGSLAAEHLASRGYPHFAFVGSSEMHWSKLRWQGFNDWLTARNFRSSAYEFSTAELPFHWSWNTAKRSRALQKVLAKLPRPCGIFAANDVIAFFLIQTARDLGFRIPEDFGIVGVDDDPIPNAAAGLSISSVQIAFREIGRQAAWLMDQLLKGEPVPKQIKVAPIRVVSRVSTNAFMADDPLVQRAQKYIEAHLPRNVSVNEVVRSVGSNRFRLGQRFRRTLDTGLLEYVKKRRIAHAEELLRAGKLTVGQVADTCGYSSAAFFSRAFKAVTGRTPRSVGQMRVEPPPTYLTSECGQRVET